MIWFFMVVATAAAYVTASGAKARDGGSMPLQKWVEWWVVVWLFTFLPLFFIVGAYGFYKTGSGSFYLL